MVVMATAQQIGHYSVQQAQIDHRSREETVLCMVEIQLTEAYPLIFPIRRKPIRLIRRDSYRAPTTSGLTSSSISSMARTNYILSLLRDNRTIPAATTAAAF